MMSTKELLIEKIINMYVEKKLTQRQISDILGISPKKIRDLLYYAITNLCISRKAVVGIYERAVKNQLSAGQCPERTEKYYKNLLTKYDNKASTVIKWLKAEICIKDFQISNYNSSFISYDSGPSKEELESEKCKLEEELSKATIFFLK